MSKANPLNLNPSPHLDPAPEETALDRTLTVAKVGAILLPPLATVTAFLELFITPRVGQRMNNWYEDVYFHVNDLIEKVAGLTPEKLANNDAFLSAFLQATQAALKTHQKEKLDALRNAVLNVAAGTTLAEDLQTLFINLIDSLTPQHLVALDYLHHRDQSLWAKLSPDRDLLDQAVTDLNSRGMIKDTRPYAARGRDTGDLLIKSPWEIAGMGKQFLAFIKAPVVP